MASAREIAHRTGLARATTRRRHGKWSRGSTRDSPPHHAMLTVASNLAAARSQMAFTLGFHIILASLGVALPALMLIANYRGLRRDDADALKLAQRWSKAVAG